MSAEVAAGLDRAAAIIKARGWTRGDLEHRGRVCLVRALELANAGRAETIAEAFRQSHDLHVAVCQEVGTDDLVGWNDRVASSRAEVLRVLRAAAGRARKEED